MRSLTLAGVGFALALAVPAFARTNVSIGVGINVPPPPVVVYRAEPRWVYVPHQRVYVVDDDDIDYDYFRYAGVYYIYDNDHWYRSRSYRGPFVAVRADYVPGPIWSLSVDRGYRWRHHPHDMPPWLASRYRGQDRDWDRDNHDNHDKHGKHGHHHGDDD